MAFILPNWQNKNNRLYTQVVGHLKKPNINRENTIGIGYLCKLNLRKIYDILE